MKFSLLLLIASTCVGADFDWSQILNPPPGVHLKNGHQLFKFKSSDKPYFNDEQALQFVEKYLKDATVFQSDAEVLKYGSDHMTLQGSIIELGVCTGKSINFLAALNPLQTIYGFDSFEGLPEDWVRADRTITKGTFGFKNPDNLPPVLNNVQLIKGWFADTLKQAPDQPIALIHFDCDLYSSSATAFEILGDRIVPGTILVFDEFYNYPGSENHEFKALYEFLERKNLDVRYLAFNANHEQVALQIIEKVPE